MNFVHCQSYQIGQTTETIIQSKNCFKVKVRNDSPGHITVSGLIIEPQREETFDGLPSGAVFIRDFDLNAEDAITAVIFVTRYFFTDKC